MASHNELGTLGEQIALSYLQEKGYEILEKNYRYLKAEVDLIAKHKDLIVFLEVKARSTNFFGEPELAVTLSKQKLLIEAADHYAVSNNLQNEIRFDVIAIIINKNETTIKHIEDAFYPQVD
jgi:putative endonuclease